MITLGELKEHFATMTVNQGLRGSGSPLGSIVHWVVTDILSYADYWWNQGSDTFSTVSAQAEYFLNNRVSGDKIWGMFDQTNDRPLHKKTLSYLYSVDPTPTDSGNASFWAYVGQEECQAVPTVAGVATVVSSSAQDSGIEVMLKGKSGGIEYYEALSLTGIGTVTGSVSWDASSPISISLASKTAGVVTVARGAITVGQIPPGHLRVQRPRIRLMSVPDSVSTIQYFFYKRSLPLVRDSEIVDLPDEAFKALRFGVEEITYQLVGKLQAANNAYNKRKEAIAELISWSERDVAGNEIKIYKEPLPFAYRLPTTINGSVTV